MVRGVLHFLLLSYVGLVVWTVVRVWDIKLQIIGLIVELFFPGCRDL